MSEELGISRTPVREALGAPGAGGGSLRSRPARGVFIKRKSMDEILEMIVTWAALESMAARLATQHASDKRKSQLCAGWRPSSARTRSRRISTSTPKPTSSSTSASSNLSKCAMLKDIADGLFLHMRAIRNRAMAEGDRIRRSVVDHMHIIEALEDRDADLASELVREHTMRLHAHVRRSWKEFLGRSPRRDLGCGFGAIGL